MKLDRDAPLWQVISGAALLLLGVVTTILAYGVILAVIGAVIAWAADGLSGAIAASMANTAATISDPTSYVPPPTSAELIGSLGPLNDNWVIVLSVLAVCLLTAFALRWFNVVKPNQAKFDAAIEKVTEWLVKAAELILLAVVFMLAAKKMPAWPVQLFSLLIFGCLAFHIIKPIAGLVTGPAMSAMGKKQTAAAGVGVFVLMAVAFYLTWTILSLLSVAINGLIEAGISP